jgi:hypothetical protein
VGKSLQNTAKKPQKCSLEAMARANLQMRPLTVSAKFDLVCGPRLDRIAKIFS